MCLCCLISWANISLYEDKVENCIISIYIRFLIKYVITFAIRAVKLWLRDVKNYVVITGVQSTALAEYPALGWIQSAEYRVVMCKQTQLHTYTHG